MVVMISCFLSCLSGSERRPILRKNAVTFLSCLSGSELPFNGHIYGLIFLSCLSGSERIKAL